MLPEPTHSGRILRRREVGLKKTKKLSKISFSAKNNIPPSESDTGAEGHGTVVFAVATTVPCSGKNFSIKSLLVAGTVECRNNELFFDSL